MQEEAGLKLWSVFALLHLAVVHGRQFSRHVGAGGTGGTMWFAVSVKVVS